MKCISLSILVVLPLALLVSAYSQATQSGAVKKVQVTAQTLASLPAGKPYIIDLSRNGTVYTVASGVDYSRIQVRTSTGTLESLPNLMKKAGAIGKTIGKAANLILGTASDLPKIGGKGDGGCREVECFDAAGSTKACWCAIPSYR